ncbi:MAG TPA: DUF397 domain-containing protein [Pseudonocardiaceae bacterium]|jgi:hypothetical protein
MTIGPHRWRKSSHSGTQTNCVELVNTLDMVRDSKNPTGRSLRVNLATLLADVKSGRITR